MSITLIGGKMGAGQVQIIRWPAESSRVHIARGQGMLCLFVVEGGCPAPTVNDIREDWIRVPAPRDDFAVRISALQARAGSYAAPVLDLDGVLYFNGRTVALSATEEEFLRPLIQRFGKIIPREEIISALSRERGDMSRNALDLQVLRIRRRVGQLGLQLRTVWRRGYLLTLAEAGKE
jgi:hypothetical protein